MDEEVRHRALGQGSVFTGLLPRADRDAGPGAGAWRGPAALHARQGTRVPERDRPEKIGAGFSKRRPTGVQ